MNSKRSTIPQDVPIFLPNILPTGEEEPIVYNLQANDFVINRLTRAGHDGNASILFTSLTEGKVQLKDQPPIKFKLKKEASKFCEGPRSVCFSRRETRFRKVGVTEGEIILENPMDTEVSPSFRERARAQAEAKSKNSIFIDERLTFMRDPSTRRRGGRPTPQRSETRSFPDKRTSFFAPGGSSLTGGQRQSPTGATTRARVTTDRAKTYTPGQSSERSTPTSSSAPRGKRGISTGLRSKLSPAVAIRSKAGSTGLRSARAPSTGVRSDLLSSKGLKPTPLSSTTVKNDPATSAEPGGEAGPSSRRKKPTLFEGLRSKLTSLTGFERPMAAARSKLAHTFHPSRGESSRSPRSPAGTDNTGAQSGTKRNRENDEGSRKKARVGNKFSKEQAKATQDTQNSEERRKRQPGRSQERRSSKGNGENLKSEIQPNVPSSSGTPGRKRQREETPKQSMDDGLVEIKPNRLPQRQCDVQYVKGKRAQSLAAQRERAKIAQAEKAAADVTEPKVKRSRLSERVKTPYKQYSESSSSSEEDDSSYDSESESEEEAKPLSKGKTASRSSFGKKGLPKVENPHASKDRGQSSKVTGKSFSAGAASSSKKKTPQKKSNEKQVSKPTPDRRTPGSASSRGDSRRNDRNDVGDQRKNRTPVQRKTKKASQEQPSSTKSLRSTRSKSKTSAQNITPRKNDTKDHRDVGSASGVRKEADTNDEDVEVIDIVDTAESSSSDPDADDMAALLMRENKQEEGQANKKSTGKADGKRSVTKSKRSKQESDDEYSDEHEDSNEETAKARPTTGGKGLVPYEDIRNHQKNAGTSSAQPEESQDASSSSESESAESSSSDSGDDEENTSSSSDHNSYNSDQYSSSSTIELEER